jgi:hypothetical protein
MASCRQCRSVIGVHALQLFDVTQRMLDARHDAQRRWQSVQVLIVPRLAEVLTQPFGSPFGCEGTAFRDW